MTNADVLVVIPAFNESPSVGSVVRAVRAEGYDVVVVDDGSRDETRSVAREAGAVVLRLPINLGVGGALRCGFRYAIGEGYSKVVQCDADGQHMPGYIPRLLQAAESSQADLVIGSRFLASGSYPGPSRARRFAINILSRVASRAVGHRLTDVTSGFRLFSGALLRCFADEFPAYYLGDTFEATYAAGRSGYRVVEVPVDMNDRAHGESSASTISAVGLIAKVLLVTRFGLHFDVPHSVVTQGADPT